MVGLAIGCAARTLVKDVIAGVFFLIEYAFRVGEEHEFHMQPGQCLYFGPDGQLAAKGRDHG